PLPVVGTKAAVIAKDLTTDKNAEIQEILDCILPPREWEEDGQLWRQQVSSQPATRAEVLKLGENLDMRLQQRQARETGICAIRRELFTQAFDELIRQVTINCAERGLLLLRVRDEMRMTTAAYQALYESSTAFGLRKALMSEQGKSDMEEEIQRLKTEKDEVQNELAKLKQRFDMSERRAAEMRQTEEKKHNEEISFLKKTNQQLKVHFASLLLFLSVNQRKKLVLILLLNWWFILIAIMQMADITCLVSA
ncbi:hypothetical protein AAG570_002264, partial [Ranatra chinensis]